MTKEVGFLFPASCTGYAEPGHELFPGYREEVARLLARASQVVAFDPARFDRPADDLEAHDVCYINSCVVSVCWERPAILLHRLAPASPCTAAPRAPPDRAHGAPSEPPDIESVPDPDSTESGCREAQSEASRELQSVLDPEFLPQPRRPTPTGRSGGRGQAFRLRSLNDPIRTAKPRAPSKGSS